MIHSYCLTCMYHPEPRCPLHALSSLSCFANRSCMSACTIDDDMLSVELGVYWYAFKVIVLVLYNKKGCISYRYWHASSSYSYLLLSHTPSCELRVLPVVQQYLVVTCIPYTCMYTCYEKLTLQINSRDRVTSSVIAFSALYAQVRTVQLSSVDRWDSD